MRPRTKQKNQIAFSKQLEVEHFFVTGVFVEIAGVVGTRQYTARHRARNASNAVHESGSTHQHTQQMQRGHRKTARGTLTVNAAALQDALSRKCTLGKGAALIPQQQRSLVTNSNAPPQLPVGPVALSQTAHRWCCDTCRALNRAGALQCSCCGGHKLACVRAEAPAALTLAQLRGLDAMPPERLTPDQWRELELLALRRLTTRSGGSRPHNACAICQDALGLRSQLLLSCGHVYHQQCMMSLKAFLQQHRNPVACPTCRAVDVSCLTTTIGAHAFVLDSIVLLQSLARGVSARSRWKAVLRQHYFRDPMGSYQSAPPVDQARKSAFIAAELDRLHCSMSSAMLQREHNVACLLQTIDAKLSSSRAVILSSAEVRSASSLCCDDARAANAAHVNRSRLSPAGTASVSGGSGDGVDLYNDPPCSGRLFDSCSPTTLAGAVTAAEEEDGRAISRVVHAADAMLNLRILHDIGATDRMRELASNNETQRLAHQRRVTAAAMQAESTSAAIAEYCRTSAAISDFSNLSSGERQFPLQPRLATAGSSGLYRERQHASTTAASFPVMNDIDTGATFDWSAVMGSALARFSMSEHHEHGKSENLVLRTTGATHNTLPPHSVLNFGDCPICITPLLCCASNSIGDAAVFASRERRLTLLSCTHVLHDACTSTLEQYGARAVIAAAAVAVAVAAPDSRVGAGRHGALCPVCRAAYCRIPMPTITDVQRLEFQWQHQQQQ